jgi:hypothetical protein
MQIATEKDILLNVSPASDIGKTVIHAYETCKLQSYLCCNLYIPCKKIAEIAIFYKAACPLDLASLHPGTTELWRGL